jgi:endonuclease/exonuclease/phosphatase family metal-dependent hydrolase
MLKKFMYSLFGLGACVHGFGAEALQYYLSQAKEQHVGRDAEISLLTWNILGLPNDQVAVRPWEERIDGIAERILSINADVVILQECFVPDLSLGLQRKLQHVYAHTYLHLTAPTPLPSGLALFSKLPLAHLRFIPHDDLLDTERHARMGILAFVVLNSEKAPVAHIAASHFQGSSNCEWRVGVTESGERLSYTEVRQREAKALLSLSAERDIPHYVCGDLNVDRRSPEYDLSLLNPTITPPLKNGMSPCLHQMGTNTNFWKHHRGIAKLYPHLTQHQVLDLALQYKKWYEEHVKDRLSVYPFQQPLSAFDPSFLNRLEEQLHLSLPADTRIWEYFKTAALQAIHREKELWQSNQNPGENPPVSIGRVLEIRALPIEESLDYVLGTNPCAQVKQVKILQGYDDRSIENTLSDHHPVWAMLRTAQNAKKVF